MEESAAEEDRGCSPAPRLSFHAGMTPPVTTEERDKGEKEAADIRLMRRLGLLPPSESMEAERSRADGYAAGGDEEDDDDVLDLDAAGEEEDEQEEQEEEKAEGNDGAEVDEVVEHRHGAAATHAVQPSSATEAAAYTAAQAVAETGAAVEEATSLQAEEMERTQEEEEEAGAEMAEKASAVIRAALSASVTEESVHLAVATAEETSTLAEEARSPQPGETPRGEDGAAMDEVEQFVAENTNKAAHEVPASTATATDESTHSVPEAVQGRGAAVKKVPPALAEEAAPSLQQDGAAVVDEVEHVVAETSNVVAQDPLPLSVEEETLDSTRTVITEEDERDAPADVVRDAAPATAMSAALGATSARFDRPDAAQPSSVTDSAKVPACSPSAEPSPTPAAPQDINSTRDAGVTGAASAASPAAPAAHPAVQVQMRVKSTPAPSKDVLCDDNVIRSRRGTIMGKRGSLSDLRKRFQQQNNESTSELTPASARQSRRTSTASVDSVDSIGSVDSVASVSSSSRRGMTKLTETSEEGGAVAAVSEEGQIASRRGTMMGRAGLVSKFRGMFVKKAESQAKPRSLADRLAEVSGSDSGGVAGKVGGGKTCLSLTHRPPKAVLALISPSSG